MSVFICMIIIWGCLGVGVGVGIMWGPMKEGGPNYGYIGVKVFGDTFYPSG